MIRQRQDDYNPLYFLAAMGTGGIAITFYIYLMFMVEHPDAPLVTINHLWPILREGSPLAGALSGLALLAILFFTALHLRLVAWNLLKFDHFRHTEAYRHLRNSGSEISLLAIPLTLAMSVNVVFMSGMMVVPHLWRDAELLFPVVATAYLAIGILAIFLYGRFLLRVLHGRDRGAISNNSLAQLLAVFAFAMVAMGLAAPGCMSQQSYAGTLGAAGSLAFATLAAVLGVIQFGFGLRALQRRRISKAASPGLWITIPILTLLGIVAVRTQLGPMQGFDQALLRPGLFVITAAILGLQLLFGGLGYAVMQRLGYFRDYLHGGQHHPGSYTLICPGIALFVFGMYFVSYGMVKTGLIERFSLSYFTLLAPLVVVQFKTITTLFRINGRLLGNPLAV